MKQAWPDGFVCAPSESKRSLFKPFRLTKGGPGGVASSDTDMSISNFKFATYQGLPTE